MTVTANLPQQAVATPVAESQNVREMTNVQGIPVLRTGQILDPALVDATLEQIRHERDLASC